MMATVLRQMTFDELWHQPRSEDSLAIDESFPEEFVAELSRLEAMNKHLFRPNTYLHKWWARRCGSTFRAILKQFVADPARRDYYVPGGLEGKVVLDPMMGGGTTLHEAIRLGAHVIGADLDPIPIVQARASLAQVSLQDLQAAFDQFHARLYENVGPYFQTECPHCRKTLDAHYTLHGLRKRCTCGEVVQIDQYELRHETGRTLRIRPESWEIEEMRIADCEMRIDRTPDPANPQSAIRLIPKSETTCPICEQKYQDLLDWPFYARYIPFAVVGICPEHGLFFHPPGAADLERIRAADERRAALDFGPIGDFAVRNGPKSGDLLRRNVHSYLDLFSSRQLLYLYHAIQELQQFEGTVQLNLALLVSTSLEFNALLCGYKGWFRNRPGAIRHVFGLHAYSIQYTALENNPVNWQKSSGNLHLLFRDRIVRGRQWAAAPIERRIDSQNQTRPVTLHGEVDGGREVYHPAALETGRQTFWLIHGDSRHLPVDDGSVNFIVTDPPYYDSVQYSDLAAFFRVWLARLLPSEVHWTYDETHSAVATQADDGETSFGTVLSGIFQECGRVLKPRTGRLVFTFHHWNPNAWAELTLALQSAGFRLVNAYVVYSEHPISVHIRGLNSLKHDAILVLASDGHGPSRYWPPLDKIDTDDSETFCRQCSKALGWLLGSDCPPEEIRTTWKTLIQTAELPYKSAIRAAIASIKVSRQPGPRMDGSS